MTEYTLDPTKLDDPTSPPELRRLLIQMIDLSESHFIPADNYTITEGEQQTIIHLTHNLLIRNREGKSSLPEQERVEVLAKKPLSNGGFSTVYRSLGVLQPELNCHFKIKPEEKERLCKVIPYSATSTVEHIDAEAHFTKYNKLLHCKEAIFDDISGFIMMRRMKGKELFNLYKHGQGRKILTVKERLLLSYAILKAVKEQVYDLGLIHNDLKLENIIVDIHSLQGMDGFPLMKVTIIDYAFAQYKDNLISTHLKGFGTPHYIAPEVVSRNERSQQSDNFSTGLTLAELWGDMSGETLKQGGDLIDHQFYRQWLKLFAGMDVNNDLKTKITKILDGLAQFDSTKRMDIQTALNEWHTILTEYIQTNPQPAEQSALNSATDNDSQRQNPNLFFNAATKTYVEAKFLHKRWASF